MPQGQKSILQKIRNFFKPRKKLHSAPQSLSIAQHNYMSNPFIERLASAGISAELPQQRSRSRSLPAFILELQRPTSTSSVTYLDGRTSSAQPAGPAYRDSSHLSVRIPSDPPVVNDTPFEDRFARSLAPRRGSSSESVSRVLDLDDRGRAETVSRPINPSPSFEFPLPAHESSERRNPKRNKLNLRLVFTGLILFILIIAAVAAYLFIPPFTVFVNTLVVSTLAFLQSLPNIMQALGHSILNLTPLSLSSTAEIILGGSIMSAITSVITMSTIFSISGIVKAFQRKPDSHTSELPPSVVPPTAARRASYPLTVRPTSIGRPLETTYIGNPQSQSPEPRRPH